MVSTRVGRNTVVEPIVILKLPLGSWTPTIWHIIGDFAWGHTAVPVTETVFSFNQVCN